MSTVAFMAHRRQSKQGGSDRPMTVRVPVDDFEFLAAVAAAEGTSSADQLRQAAQSYVHRRRHDPDLEAQIEAALGRQKATLDALRSGASEPLGAGPSREGRPKDRERERAVSFRASETLISHLTGLALLDDSTIADQLREATSTYIEERRRDPELISRLETVHMQQKGVLGAFACAT